jgi:hypothetical protein
MDESSPTPTTLILARGIPLYAANLVHTVRLFDPETGNYSGLALPVDVVKDLMRTGHSLYMRFY